MVNPTRTEKGKEMERKTFARFHHHHKIYPQLPMKSKSQLTDAGFPTREIEVGTIYEWRQNDNLEHYKAEMPILRDVCCIPKTAEARGGRPRLYCKCVCKKWIPMGRIGQHSEYCVIFQNAL